MTVAGASGAISEDEISEALSQVLLSSGSDEIEGLDDDLVSYISGMVASRTIDGENEDPETIVEESLTPFLDSVACPDDLAQKAQSVVLELLQKHQSKGSSATTGGSAHDHDGANATTTRKLHGMVSMSSDLGNANEHEAEANRYLWGTEGGVKPMANELFDGHSRDNISSSKSKRKLRKVEAERARKLLASSQDQDVDADEAGGLVRMNYKTFDVMDNEGVKDKKKDVLVRNVTVALDNGTTLLDHGELKFAYQRRYGLIGENGVGKTTLLKAISRQDDILDGFPSHLRVLHVRQEVPSHLSHDLTVTNAVLQSDIERMELLKQEKELLAKLEADDEKELSLQEKRQKLLKKKDGDSSSSSSISNADDIDPALKQMQIDLKRLDAVYSRLQVLSSDSAEARAAMILTGLQFDLAKQHAPISSLSGGWKMRVALAAALFIEPDLLLLDEPTNHLDLEAVLWLESYLTQYKHTLVVVSHDRSFLNEICTDIIEFKKKKLTYYRGNFNSYIKLRDENTRNAIRVYEAYATKREHMMEFITKFRANAKRATMVQSRIKAVEKMDAEAPEKVEIDQVWRFSIPNSEPLGPPIISINDVSFDYSPELECGSKKPEGEYLLQQVNFGVDLKSKIAVLGKNGMGKTTLLNLIMGKIQPIKGNVSINATLRIGHFTQHSADNFDLTLSAVENLLNMFEEAEDQEVRSFLGKFQIQGNDALKPMMLLSGGQKSRVAFAALAYKKPHVLIIDEGSNHLSMEAVDALVEAIQNFDGGIMVVSHDEYFVSKTCDELWVVDDGKAIRFRGDFEEYKQHTAAETQKRVEESVKRLHAVNN